MAFKFKTIAAVGALIGSLALVGCGQDEKIRTTSKLASLSARNNRLLKSHKKSQKKNTVWTLNW